MSKYCKKCKKLNENPLIKLCRSCYYEEQLNNPKQQNFSSIKKISEKRKKRIKETWWEKPFFEKIWNSSNKTCVICWKKILEPKSWCFAHILSKKDYPMLRLFKNNIALVCSIKCHGEVDKRVSWNKMAIEKQILDWKTIF